MDKNDVTERLERLEKDIRLLSEKIEKIEKILLDQNLDIVEVTTLISMVRRLIDFQARAVGVAARITELKSLPPVKDDISKHIIEVLALKGALNISQITEELKSRRGTGSRRIISLKLQKLVKAGIVEEIPSRKKERRFRLKEKTKD